MPGPMGGPMRGGNKGSIEKAKDFKGTTKKLIKNYLAKYKIGLIIVLIFAVGSINSDASHPSAISFRIAAFDANGQLIGFKSL